MGAGIMKLVCTDDRKLRSVRYVAGIIRTHEFHYPCTHPFRYRTDRSLRSSVHTSFIIPAPSVTVTVQTGVYDHPYTRVSLSLHPSVPLPYRPEFTIIRTHEFHYPCTLRSVTVQTGVYDHPYTRVSLSLQTPFRTVQTGV